MRSNRGGACGAVETGERASVDTGSPALRVRRASIVLWLLVLFLPFGLASAPPPRYALLVVGVVSDPPCAKEVRLMRALQDAVGYEGLSFRVVVASMHLDVPTERTLLTPLGFCGSDDAACGFVELNRANLPSRILFRYDVVRNVGRTALRAARRVRRLLGAGTFP